MTLDAFRAETRDRLEDHLEQWLSTGPAPRLLDAMRHAVLGGGKRLRPLLVRATAVSLGDDSDRWLYPAAALEMVHAYSLVHDDLPAMDNDDLRRGRPTCHRAFDEATAILAGDALQSLAFEHLGAAPGLNEATRLAMIRRLAEQAGRAGMVAGQMLDLQAESRQQTLAELEAIHRLKTAALIETALHFGALCLGESGEAERAPLRRYGQALGLAFQITDDILDVTTDTTTLGKPQGSDAARDKSTYVSLLSLDGARLKAREQIDLARQALDELGLAADAPLRGLTDLILDRDH